MKPSSFVPGILAALLLAAASQAQEVPQYRVDPSWPADLPNDWILGQVAGIAVDGQDNVWVVHRPRSISESEMGAVLDPPLAHCCVPAPSVLQFDPAGNLLQAWGGPSWNAEAQQWDAPGYDWPDNEHGIFVDAGGQVWLAGNGPDDHIVTRFAPDGTHRLTIGQDGGAGSNATGRLGRPADIYVDVAAAEVYVADGYGNRRIIVYDRESGAYKRHWGAYGNRPDDGPLAAYREGEMPPPQFRGPVHAVLMGPDNRLYTVDRGSNRIQVFETDGSFVRESVLAPWTRGNGSAWDLALSPGGRWLFVADGQNMQVWILDRESLAPVGSFGRGGRQAGQFDWVHNVAVDSQGNVYTAEVNNGRRIQKFTPQQGR